MHVNRLVLGGLICLLTSTQRARAEPAQREQTSSDAKPPLTELQEQRSTPTNHEGLYLRVDAGASLTSLRYGPIRPGLEASNYFVPGGAFGALAGVSLTPSLALGIGVDYRYVPSLGTQPADRHVTTVAFGPFVDIFPDPSSGFHVGGTAGYVRFSTAFAGADARIDDGFGGGLWGGYDFRVGPNLSVGGLVRLNGQFGFSDDDSYNQSVRALSAGLFLTAAVY